MRDRSTLLTGAYPLYTAVAKGVIIDWPLGTRQRLENIRGDQQVRIEVR